MAEFGPAIDVILKHEGGWVDDPADPGGETNFGLSMLIIRREKLKPSDLGLAGETFSHGSLQAMTEAAAREVYRQLFWDRFGYGQIADQAVATKVFDCAVNMGPTWGHRLAQYAANECGASPALEADGFLGPKTFSALNAVNPRVWLKAMCAQMAARYRLIAAARPRSVKFLPCWLRRAAWTPAR